MYDDLLGDYYYYFRALVNVLRECYCDTYKKAVFRKICKIVYQTRHFCILMLFVF